MLEIKNLETPLFGPVSLAVERGECVAIQGPSGSGKSLLLRAVVDLDPNEGEVRLDGNARERMAAHVWRTRVGLVPAESGWWSDRVGDHFDPEEEPRALLDAIGLPDALGWNVSRLSSGERHRLAIVRALADRPAALLLDEPTATLDAAATRLVEAVLREECARGVAMIVVTHDQAQPERLSARRFAMERGRLEPWPEAVS
jgi:ABC-type iron transport system FetAB ATPase subunit